MNYQNSQPSGYRFLPEVVKNLLIINIIAYLATQFFLNQGLDLTDILGLHYFGAPKFRIFQIVTYMFMHDTGSIMHIFFNMLALYMFGGAVENMWGGKKFLTYYLLTGFGAAITHYAVVYYQINPGIQFFNDYMNSVSLEKMYALVNSSTFGSKFSPEFLETMRVDPSKALLLSIDYAQQFKEELLNAPVVIGASGAVYGVLLAFGILFPNTILYLFFALPIKAKYAVIIFGILELYLGISSGDNVAHFAHLGGLLTGLLIIFIWKNKDRKRRDDYFNQS